jgi:hypothetical protein
MKSFKQLQEEIIILNKNGINFLLAASFSWLLIATIWYLPLAEQSKPMFTFFAVAPMMPLAFLFSKAFKTSWNIQGNPLNSLGLWLNFAQLFYFPFVFIFFASNPVQMPMALAIITGAHFFPYAWFYQTKSYAFMAGFISLSSAIIGTSSIANAPMWIALILSVCLAIQTVWAFADYKKVKEKQHQKKEEAVLA